MQLATFGAPQKLVGSRLAARNIRQKRVRRKPVFEQRFFPQRRSDAKRIFLVIRCNLEPTARQQASRELVKERCIEHSPPLMASLGPRIRKIDPELIDERQRREHGQQRLASAVKEPDIVNFVRRR